MSSHTFRPLLPVVSAAIPPVGKPVRPRGKKASLACTECRKRKSKCVGLPPPCERCRQHRTPCILDEDSDRRRRGGLERRVDALEQDRTLLLRLVDSIRNESLDEAIRIVDLVRRDASLDEMRQYMDRKSSSREVEEILPQCNFGDPLYHVPAHPWTTVTDDKNYVSHLISLYFTWGFPVQKWIDRDLFIRDMQSSRTDSRFCSPFLVNALLAVACCYCDLSGRSPACGAVLPGSSSFYHEAQRLLDQEKGPISLTGFQGRCELYLSTWIMGKHALAWQYLSEIADLTRELMKWRNAITARADNDHWELARALDTAVTGSFSAPQVAFPGLHQPPIVLKAMPEPTTCRLLSQDHDSEDMWCPYTIGKGEMKGPVPAHSNCVSTELFNLQLILWEISNNPFRSIEQLSFTSVEMTVIFHQRLEQWLRELLECLTLASLLNSAPTPALLDMHLRYHSAIILIFDGSNAVNQDTLVMSERIFQNIRVSSAHSICSLLEKFVARWTVLYMPFIYIRYALMALSTLLVDLDNSVSKAYFANSYTALHTLAFRYPMAKEVLQIIVEQARQLQATLPKEVTCLPTLVESDFVYKLPSPREVLQSS
ncbi:uncharacterized protein BDV17DRAFT_278081 [Aspergillus undulatus]|uniref:uncharacterized protein n=1 Tax=Aspergillus undulatus TaxID=1810928 RepID=UPI003CCE4AF9